MRLYYHKNIVVSCTFLFYGIGMAEKPILVRLCLDDEMYGLLQSYAEHLQNLLLAKMGTRAYFNKSKRVSYIVNAILIKFLTDNAKRIRYAEHARRIRRAAQHIHDPTISAKAARAAEAAIRAANTARTGYTEQA